MYEPEEREVGEGRREWARKQVLGEVEADEIPAGRDGGRKRGVDVVVRERGKEAERDGESTGDGGAVEIYLHDRALAVAGDGGPVAGGGVSGVPPGQRRRRIGEGELRPQ